MASTWAKVSVGLITFAFINFALFLALNSPMATLFDTIEEQGNKTGLNTSAYAWSFHSTLDIWRSVFGLMFVLSFIGLIVWFFLGSHREEYEEY